MTVAHRLLTIADYDSILVFDGGKVVEHDAPVSLLLSDISQNEVKQRGYFADMVRHTGPKTSLLILEKAKKSYFAKNSFNDQTPL